ncbi:MAG: NAD(P)/FAD-dependent oxidoreductase [Erythrobacter sp.]
MIHDIIIVGAGPAGLSAALYAARFLRSTLVLHDGKPRAAQVPLTRNVPGYEDGIASCELLACMTRHAGAYGAGIAEAEVTGARRGEDGLFRIEGAGGEAWTARALILATGSNRTSPRCRQTSTKRRSMPACCATARCATDSSTRESASRCSAATSRARPRRCSSRPIRTT